MGYQGYASKRKLASDGSHFVTVEPVAPEQFGQSVKSYLFTESIGTDAAESGSASGDIKATAHAAKVGDIIRVTSGTYSGRETPVLRVATDNIYIADDIVMSAADTFAIYRYRSPRINSSGEILTSASLAAGPIQYDLNGVDTEVKEDTSTVANNRPLPIKAMGQLGVAVSGSGSAANATPVAAVEVKDYRSIFLQFSGTFSATCTFEGSNDNTNWSSCLGQRIDSNSASMLPTLTNSTTALFFYVPVRFRYFRVRISSYSSGTVNIDAFFSMAAGDGINVKNCNILAGSVSAAQSGTWNITNISGTVSLPTGASTAANQSTIIGHVDGIESALTTLNAKDFATETTLAAMSAKLPATLGQKTMANSMAVVIASDQTVIPASQSGSWSVAQSGNWSVRAQDGSGNALTSAAVGSNRGLHNKSLGGALADSARLATGSVTTGAWTQLIASTAAEAQGITVFDSSGQSVEIGLGAAASEVRTLIVPPGGLNGFIPLRIASGTRVSIRALSGTADYTSAEHLLNLIA